MLSSATRRLGIFSRGVTSRFLSTSVTSGAEVWDWVPPSSQVNKSKVGCDNYVIPVIQGVQLTTEEVRQYLESQGAENPVTIKINGDLGEFTDMVIASGRSVRHIRKMTESIISAMKERRLKFDNIEGDADDDWQAVNCKTFIVHVMMPKTRKAVDLESHWTAPKRPSIDFHADEKVYEANFMRLLKEHPVPADYVQAADIAVEEPVVKEF